MGTAPDLPSSRGARPRAGPRGSKPPRNSTSSQAPVYCCICAAVGSTFRKSSAACAAQLFGLRVVLVRGGRRAVQFAANELHREVDDFLGHRNHRLRALAGHDRLLGRSAHP